MSRETSPEDHSILIDVLLPVREPAPWLEETLIALSLQSVHNWNLVALVHGPSTQSLPLIRRYFPNAKIVEAPTSVSFPELLNLGLQNSSAPFIARLDADDIPEPNRFEIQLAFLQENEECAVLATTVSLIDDQGDFLGFGFQGDEDTLRQALKWKNVIAHTSVLMRRISLESCGAYSPQAIHLEDYDLWLRLACNWKILWLGIPLTKYRMHDHQVTKSKPIPNSSLRRIRSSRLKLAKSRNESIAAAWFRNAVWSTVQRLRWLSRFR